MVDVLPERSSTTSRERGAATPERSRPVRPETCCATIRPALRRAGARTVLRQRRNRRAARTARRGPRAPRRLGSRAPRRCSKPVARATAEATNYQDAIRLLLDARQLNRDSAALCWYLADSYLIASYVPESPFAEREAVARGLEHWEAGDRLGPAGLPFVWAFCTRASLEHQAARLKSWPPVGRKDGGQWGDLMAAVGEKPMAIDRQQGQGRAADAALTRGGLLRPCPPNRTCPFLSIRLSDRTCGGRS